MLVNKYLPIAEIAEQADIANSTCRRYLTTFESFFLVRGGSRLKRYEANSVDILKRIKQLYDEGQDTNEIHNVLVNEFPMVIDGDKQPESNEHVSGLATAEDITEIKQALDEQKQFNQQLLEHIKHQHLYYEQKFEELKYDRDFVHSLRSSMEQRRIESSEHENTTNEQLKEINHQLLEIKQDEKVKELSEHVANLSKQLEQMVETAASQEDKKGFFARLFGKKGHS